MITFARCRKCGKDRFSGEFDALLAGDMICNGCKRDELERGKTPAKDVSTDEALRHLVRWNLPQLKEAAAEGRLHPDLARIMAVETGCRTCGVCGMRHWDAAGATNCCAALAPSRWQERGVSRWEAGI